MSDSGFRYPAARKVFADDRARSAADPTRVEKSVEIDLPGSLDGKVKGQVAAFRHRRRAGRRDRRRPCRAGSLTIGL
jgi:hypothetical protein